MMLYYADGLVEVEREPGVFHLLGQIMGPPSLPIVIILICFSKSIKYLKRSNKAREALVGGRQ
jgi:hypothetical protein